MSKIKHPGDYLREELRKRNIVHKKFAKGIKMYQSHFCDLIQGRRRITTVLAHRISKALGDSIPEYWLELQAIWDLHQLSEGK